MQPVPGRNMMNVLSYIRNDGQLMQETIEEKQSKHAEEDDTVIMCPRPRTVPKRFAVKREDIEQYGITEKCNGRLRIANKWVGNAQRKEICRTRIMNLIMGEGDPEGRVAKAIER